MDLISEAIKDVEQTSFEYTAWCVRYYQIWIWL